MVVRQMLIINGIIFIRYIVLDYGKENMSDSPTKEALSVLNAARVETRDVLGRKNGGFYFQAENQAHADRLIKAVAQVYEGNAQTYMKLIRLQESST